MGLYIGYTADLIFNSILNCIQNNENFVHQKTTFSLSKIMTDACYFCQTFAYQ